MTTSSEDYENFKKNMEKRILNQVSDMAVYSDDADNIKKRLMQWKFSRFTKESKKLTIILDFARHEGHVVVSYIISFFVLDAVYGWMWFSRAFY